MKKGDSLYGVEVAILDGVRFWGSIILSEDLGVEHITRCVAGVFKGNGFLIETLSSDCDSDAMFFTGEVKRVADGNSEMYEMILTYVMPLG